MRKKLATIALVLLILLLALPLGISMTMGHCPECTIGPGNPMLAYALIVEGALVLAGLSMTRFRAAKGYALGLLLTRRLDRPPRLG